MFGFSKSRSDENERLLREQEDFEAFLRDEVDACDARIDRLRDRSRAMWELIAARVGAEDQDLLQMAAVLRERCEGPGGEGR